MLIVVSILKKCQEKKKERKEGGFLHRMELLPLQEQALCFVLEGLCMVCILLGRMYISAVVIALCFLAWFRVFLHKNWQLWIAVAGAVLSLLFPSSFIVLALSFTFTLISVAVQWVFPIPRIRRLTSRPIGRLSFCLRDPDRRPRRVNVSVWYPCKASSSRPRHVLFDHFDVIGASLVNVLPAIPDPLRPVFRMVLAHINGPSSALQDAVPVDSPAPLCLILHGLTGPRWQNTSLAEAFAEKGWVVVAPEHPNDTACAVYDGQNEWEADGTKVTDATPETVLYSLGRPPADDQWGDDWNQWNSYLQQRIQDTDGLVVPFVLSEKFSRITGGIQLDLSHGIGVVGHSFGAAEAIELCTKNPKRYSSVVVHDLWLYPNARDLRIGSLAPPVHSLFISAEGWQWRRNIMRIARLSSRASQSTLHTHRNLVLRDGKHHSFHDLSVIAPHVGKLLKMLGGDDPSAFLAAINYTSVAFLELTMRGSKEANYVRATDGEAFPMIFPFNDARTFTEKLVDYEAEFLKRE